MSRTVIRDIVIPIVERAIGEQGFGGLGVSVQDPALEEFLEEAMRMHFGVIGANDCQHLREQLMEAIKNDPYAFEFLLKKLLEKYAKLAVKIRSAVNGKLTEKGPPDRFLQQRKVYNTLFANQGDQENQESQEAS